jgi:hypothetical protein
VCDGVFNGFFMSFRQFEGVRRKPEAEAKEEEDFFHQVFLLL